MRNTTPQYTVCLSLEAEADIEEVYQFIAYDIMAPQTAIDYYMGIYDTIDKLSSLGHVFAIHPRDYVQYRWGPEARTIPYKNMTIIYNVIGDVVLVRRVIASSMVL